MVGRTCRYCIYFEHTLTGGYCSAPQKVIFGDCSEDNYCYLFKSKRNNNLI